MTKEQKEYEAISFHHGKRLFAHAMGNLLAEQGTEVVRAELRKVLDPEAMKPFERPFDQSRLKALILKLEPADQEGYVSSPPQRNH